MCHISKKRSLISLVITLFAALTLSTGFLFKADAAHAATPVASTQNMQAAGHQPLPANDGWAAATGGTTGGSAADPANIYTVTTRAQLIQALGGDNKGTDATPKIIYIKGTIYGNQDASGKMLTCADYALNGYTLSAYMAAYDPAVWGRTAKPSGPLEDARHASELNQASYVQIYIPSNTTIIGSGDDGAHIIGANFMVKNVDNVIIRNLAFENASDCFPQWDPTDTAVGNWNSLFDNISLYNGTHVWVDHNSFTDGKQPDSSEPVYFGRIFEQHDGQCDITKGSDYVTVSWNRFRDHDKTMLIGSSDTSTSDVGKLHITLNDNEFSNTMERTPRVRFGQVHVYNNYYHEAGDAGFLYSLGVGVQSQIYDQNNYYKIPEGFPTADLIKYWGGTMIHTEGDIVNGKADNLLNDYNAFNPAATTLSSNVGWTPTYYLTIVPAQQVPELVTRYAGPGGPLTSHF